MKELLTREFLSFLSSSCCPKAFDACRCIAVFFRPLAVSCSRRLPSSPGIPDASPPCPRSPSCVQYGGWPNYGHGCSGNAWLHPAKQKYYLHFFISKTSSVTDTSKYLRSQAKIEIKPAMKKYRTQVTVCIFGLKMRILISVLSASKSELNFFWTLLL